MGGYSWNHWRHLQWDLVYIRFISPVSYRSASHLSKHKAVKWSHENSAIITSVWSVYCLKWDLANSDWDRNSFSGEFLAWGLKAGRLTPSGPSNYESAKITGLLLSPLRAEVSLGPCLGPNFCLHTLGPTGQGTAGRYTWPHSNEVNSQKHRQ